MLHDSTEVTYNHRYIIRAFKAMPQVYIPLTIVMVLVAITALFQPKLSTVIAFMFSWIMYTALMVYMVISQSIALYTKDRFMQMLEN